MNVAILITVFNRIDKTLACLKSLFEARIPNGSGISYKVFLTDDGSTDGTATKLKTAFPERPIEILPGTGNMYWNDGMNHSWRAAIAEEGYDGYLWLNNDSIIYPNLWEEILVTNEYSRKRFKKGGIYVGSTQDMHTGKFSYGGFIFTNKITLNDKFIHPNGQIQICQAAHGNITFVSQDVVTKQGVLCDGYKHSVGDHDYTYLAHKQGFPVLVMQEYVGVCENDHKSSETSMDNMSLNERLEYVKTPLGYNLNNTLLFQKRCFPYRYPFVWGLSYFRILFPKAYFRIYKFLRSQ